MSDNEGDFKKGRFKPTYIVIGLLAVAVGGVGIYFAKKTADTTLRPEEIHAEVRKVLVRPIKEQLVEWRRIADDPKADERMRQEALFQLGRLRDKESIPRIIKILGDTGNHATTRVCSMALIEFPREDAGKAKSQLEKKFDNANNEDLPQVTSALVYIRDKDYFKKIFEVYKKDILNSARTVDGSSSFDPADLALLTDRGNFRSLAKDEKGGVRQLVATVLSTTPSKEDLGTLVDLLQDKELEVSSAASVGIAKLDDPSATKILIQKLGEAEKTDNETARKRYIEALKNGIGGAGLVYALKVVPFAEADLESRGRYIMEELRDLADPAAATAYKDYLKDTNNPAHYRAQIALALADVGDVEAVPYLAERMDAKGIGFNCGGDPSPKCLSNNMGWKRQPPVDADPVTFREQQYSAQYIGDLAVLYPAKKAEFLAASAAHIKKFNSWFPAPWLIASRTLAYLGDAETLDWCKKSIKDFKMPDDKRIEPLTMELLPFYTATRYVGLTHDMAFVDTLTKFLERPKDKKGNEVRLSQSEMELAQNPGYRECLINTAQASVDGLAEWGPEANKAVEKVMKLIKDKDHNMWPRMMAGRALGMIANEKDMLAALKEAKAATDADTKVSILMGAQHKPTAEVAASALDLLAPTTDPTMLSVNAWSARVVGWAGTKGLEERLLKLLEDKDLRVYAALAIALGGDDDLVRRGMVLFEKASRDDKSPGADAEGKWKSDLNGLRSLYLDTFDSRGLTMEDLDTGRLYRFVRNAELMKRAGASDDVNDLGKTSHEWASIYLAAGFKRLDMNATVPGGVDRLILRVKLLQAAKTGDDNVKQLAIDTLKFLKEQGSVMSLREEAGSTGEMARRAFFELRHPEAAVGPQDKEKEKADPFFSKPKK
jgi:HEAT repeat protein